MAKKPKLGSGGRFKELSSSIQSKEGLSKKSADAIAYSAGAKKYGKERMSELAAKGRKRASKK